jgi:hypothetical protein
VTVAEALLATPSSIPSTISRRSMRKAFFSDEDLGRTKTAWLDGEFNDLTR